MKVLFVSSGNSNIGISPIVKSQGESLKKSSIDVSYYTIKGKGLFGYISNIKKLRLFVKKSNPDIIHAHYSISAFIASLSSCKKVGVSLMGSDVKSSNIFKPIIKMFYLFLWDFTIVKSEDMKNSINLKKAIVIPNGVNLDHFIELDKIDCQNELNWDTNKIHILFAANPNRKEKNFALAKESVELLNNLNIVLHSLNNTSHSLIPVLMNASDVILLTSNREGSPNVIKEAMACNRPIVATNVGDISWLLGDNIDGHYVSKTFKSKSIANNISKAIDYSISYKKTKGRKILMSLELDSISVAKKLIAIYEEK